MNKFVVIIALSPAEDEVHYFDDIKKCYEFIQDLLDSETKEDEIRLFELEREIDWKQELAADKNETRQEKIKQESRLEVLRDSIIFHLKESRFEFDETEIRGKIEQINDENKLSRLIKFAVISNDINSFLSKLDNQVQRQKRNTKVELVVEKELEEMGISKDQQILDELFLATDDYSKEEKLTLLAQLSYDLFKSLTPEKLHEIGIELVDLNKKINGLTVTEHSIIGRFLNEGDELTKRERDLLTQHHGHIHKVNVRTTRKMLENGENKEYIMEMLDISEQEYDLIEREIQRQNDVQICKTMLEMIEEDEKEDQELNEKYGDRLDNDDNDWIELEEGDSIIDFYKKMKQNEKWDEYQELRIKLNSSVNKREADSYFWKAKNLFEEIKIDTRKNGDKNG
jgi:hypothetical protein